MIKKRKRSRVIGINNTLWNYRREGGERYAVVKNAMVEQLENKIMMARARVRTLTRMIYRLNLHRCSAASLLCAYTFVALLPFE